MTDNTLPSPVSNFFYKDMSVRTITETDGSVLFIATDLAKILAYRDAAALTRTLDGDEKGTRPIETPGGVQQLAVITEPGLYKVILQRQTGRMDCGVTKQFVKDFQHWVTHEVLPQIRKTGGYIPIDDKDDEKTILAKAVLISRRTLAEKDNIIASQAAQLEAQKPKVLFAESVESSPDSLMLGGFAHDLRQNGVNIGRNRLFKWMREHGYLYKGGELRNEPKQAYVDCGWFEVKTVMFVKPDGTQGVGRTTKLTGRGRIHFTKLLAAAHENGEL